MDMSQLKPMEQNSVVFLSSILLITIFIPTPAQGLCLGPEACGIIVGTWLSMLTVPLCIVAFLFAIWPKTRTWLQVFAFLPGLMAILTGYLMVIQGQRFDLIFIPLIHMAIMVLMIWLGRLENPWESNKVES